MIPPTDFTSLRRDGLWRGVPYRWVELEPLVFPSKTYAVTVDGRVISTLRTGGAKFIERPGSAEGRVQLKTLSGERQTLHVVRVLFGRVWPELDEPATLSDVPEPGRDPEPECGPRPSRRNPSPSKFYVLWNPACHLPPKVRFYNLPSAKEAAEAMADRHPGQTFHVLESLGAVVKADMHWTYPEEKIPF